MQTKCHEKNIQLLCFSLKRIRMFTFMEVADISVLHNGDFTTGSLNDSLIAFLKLYSDSVVLLFYRQWKRRNAKAITMMITMTTTKTMSISMTTTKYNGENSDDTNDHDDSDWDIDDDDDDENDKNTAIVTIQQHRFPCRFHLWPDFVIITNGIYAITWEPQSPL